MNATQLTCGFVSALVTYRDRDHRGRLVRRVETINLLFDSLAIRESELRSELVEVVKGYGLVRQFDQVDCYTGGRLVASYSRGR